VTNPCDFSSYNIGTELERLKNDPRLLPWEPTVSASSRAALKHTMLFDRQRELAPLMHHTLKQIHERLNVPVGTDADALRDIEKLVDATLGELYDFDFHASPL
jgi:hypothetical protein